MDINGLNLRFMQMKRHLNFLLTNSSTLSKKYIKHHLIRPCHHFRLAFLFFISVPLLCIALYQLCFVSMKFSLEIDWRTKRYLKRMMTARLWFLFSFSDTTKSFIEFHWRTTRNIEKNAPPLELLATTTTTANDNKNENEDTIILTFRFRSSQITRERDKEKEKKT